ncbi:MAG: glycosyltransferase [Vicinamibacteria bacterium]|nr:glycosyltransferase [Vicinamibacteria bacterium]
MAICIAGMHRSGTSMVARLLHSFGLDLGPAAELRAGAPDNEHGFWEDRRFVEINTEILDRLGGGWDAPPHMEAGWETRPDLAGLRERAASLVASRSLQETWGFKDPRSSLTLPFWKTLIPNLKVIVCLRHPLEVQASLSKRGHSSKALGLRLWKEYATRILAATAPSQRVITSYDVFFENPVPELKRLCDFSGLAVSKDQIDRSLGYIARRLRHDRNSAEDLLRERVPGDIIKIYSNLCGEAGTPLSFSERCDDSGREASAAPSPATNEAEIALNLIRDRLSETTAALGQARTDVQEAAVRLNQREQEIERLSDALKDTEARLDQSERRARESRGEIDYITNSHGWEFLQLMRNVRLFLAPRGSLRDRTFQWALRRSLVHPGALAIQTEGRHLEPKLSRMSQADASFQNAALPLGSKFDVVCFPIIDWHFRFQRPQQLLTRLARDGHRVFYLAMRFHDNAGNRMEVVSENVYIVGLPSPRLDPYRDDLHGAAVDALMEALADLRHGAQVEAAVCIVQLPFWAPIALAARRRFGWKIVYDCLDDHQGYSTNSTRMLNAEPTLTSSSDLVVASSRNLLDRAAALNPRHVLIPNAADFGHFNRRASETPLDGIPRPIIGYYGAISEWFDTEMVASAAAAQPSWQFVLIGHTFGADTTALKRLPNVRLLGEQPYSSLPGFLQAFDVACIPFRRTPLTLATNPLKFYEYLSAGKPVVAVTLPELEPLRHLFYPVDHPDDFAPQIARALTECSADAVETRRRFAMSNSWNVRVHRLSEEIAAAHGRTGIVIVSYNNLGLLRQCLASVFARTLYPNFEVVVVDNGSEEDVISFLRSAASSEPRLRVIENGENLGFARANNIGIDALGGFRYLVLLNDDTVVTRGWLPRLLRHVERPETGMVGPITNWCGNEARIEAGYDERNLGGLEEFARNRMRDHDGRSFEIPMLAMFCVAMRQEVHTEVGRLDERFGIGMFEDDDYSLRVKRAGYRVLCAQDAFVHHWGRASFSKIDEEDYQRLFEENHRKFEEKWGIAWVPHQAKVEKDAGSNERRACFVTTGPASDTRSD